MFAMDQADDATNVSQAVREIKRVAVDSLEEPESCNNDIYPACGTLITTMFLLGRRPAGGEGDGVGLAIKSEGNSSPLTMHTHHQHSHTLTRQERKKLEP